MSIERYYRWEEMPLSSITALMVQLFGFHVVEYTVKKRSDVESGIWHDIVVKDSEHSFQWAVSAQRIELLKERLISQLDNLKIREEYLKPKTHE